MLQKTVFLILSLFVFSGHVECNPVDLPESDPKKGDRVEKIKKTFPRTLSGELRDAPPGHMVFGREAYENNDTTYKRISGEHMGFFDLDDCPNDKHDKNSDADIKKIFT